jgi:hypothetical protein
VSFAFHCFSPFLDKNLYLLLHTHNIFLFQLRKNLFHLTGELIRLLVHPPKQKRAVVSSAMPRVPCWVPPLQHLSTGFICTREAILESQSCIEGSVPVECTKEDGCKAYKIRFAVLAPPVSVRNDLASLETFFFSSVRDALDIFFLQT